MNKINLHLENVVESCTFILYSYNVPFHVESLLILSALLCASVYQQCQFNKFDINLTDGVLQSLYFTKFNNKLEIYFFVL